MLAQLKSATLLGLSVHLVEIEVDAAGGLPSGYCRIAGYSAKGEQRTGSHCYQKCRL